MATTGTRIYAATTTLVTTSSTIVGQGGRPDLWLLYSTTPPGFTPIWNTVSPSKTRGFNTDRGRDSVLVEVDAGTATIVVDNRDRSFDPTTGAVTLGNRWWIREQFSGETQDIFLGYAQTYTQEWPGAGRDAVTVVSCVDEFKNLALARLSLTSPPKDNYADVVLHDDPQGYWRFQGQQELQVFEPAAGSVRLASGSATTRVATPILGDYPVDVDNTLHAFGARSTTEDIYTVNSDTLAPGLEVGGPGDAGGLSAMTFEVWFKSSEATPASSREIATGPLSSAQTQWGLTLSTTGLFSAFARNSGGTLFTANGASAISANTWYHLAIVVTGANTRLYVNGAQAASASFSGSFGAMDANEFMYLGTTTAVGGTRSFDEAAFYRYAMDADRVEAHYEAGLLGFATEDDGVVRINKVLDRVTNRAPRSMPSGTFQHMAGTRMRGQPALDELKEVTRAESVDALLFVTRDGTIKFLNSQHRVASPYDTVQVTFDDDGTDVAYVDATVTFDDQMLFNDWTGNLDGPGNVPDYTTSFQTEDAASIAQYGRRPNRVADIHGFSIGDMQIAVASMLAKFKDPQTRITGITFTTADPAQTEAVFRRDIGDRVRVFRTQPNGGRIDQTLFVQKISVSASNDMGPWTINWVVSPL